jgi:SNF2 family DNA or RNA helicase
MVSRELSETAPFGGLLADGMGLGKTVQTLACMIANPPADKDRKRLIQSTLIVVPSAVILQWLDEIRHHTEESMFPKIMHYKTSSKIPMAVLRDLDIVITSYTEVMRQFPYPDAKEREKIAHMGHKKWWKLAQKDLGDLHRINWYRVVLDESHAVKNNSSKKLRVTSSKLGIY